MAELATSKKYFTLSSVRLAHRAKDDTFHLTAQDEDFPEGFHMTLSSGSSLEVRIRELFESNDLLKRQPGRASHDLLSNSTARPKVIYIGSSAVSDALSDLRKEWDFLPPVPDIASFWRLFDGTFPKDLQCLIVQDSLFDPNSKDETFEKLVAAMAPRCFFIVAGYTPREHLLMKAAIDGQFVKHKVAFTTRYFFIDPQKPNQSLNEAIAGFNADCPPDLAPFFTRLPGTKERMAAAYPNKLAV